MNWIWTTPQDAQEDSYRCFRKTFSLGLQDKHAGVTLNISADSLYDVFINGIRCPVTQFSDFPEQKTAASCSISELVHEGENCIAVRVHFIGRRFFTYTPGKPGLAVQITSAVQDATVFAETDASWKWRNDPCYTSGNAIMVSNQLGFVSCYDANGEDGWMTADYDDSSWENATVDTAFARTISPRPVPCLKELPCPVVKTVQNGWLKRTATQGTPAKIASQDYLQSDRESAVYTCGGNATTDRHLSPDLTHSLTLGPLPDGADGMYAIFDLGSETVGYLDVTLDAAPGTVVDILHGEHLDDGRVRCFIQERNFGDRLICKGGLQHYRHTLRRCGARYVELHITGTASPVTIQYAGLVPVEVPLPPQGRMALDDRLFLRIHEAAVNTLKFCMHEHYEDCPWREQALYAYDSRNQILYGYYTWGNYDFAAASLDLLGRSYFGNGDIGIIAPSRPDATMKMITSFTLVWISELYEHCMHSGSSSLFEKFQGTVQEILDMALARPVEGTALCHAQQHPNAWNFFEWTPNLSKQDEIPQSPYNLYLYEALTSAAALFQLIGNPQKAAVYRSKAQAIGVCLENTFWNDAEGCYSTLLPGKVSSSEHIQALMFYNGLIPAERQPRVFEALQSGRLNALSYSALAYYVRGLMAGTPAMRAAVEPFLDSQFAAPVLSGATSLWETPKGSDDFTYAGSLCHAWSSIHAYYAKRYILGIAPATPGFKCFQVSPYPGNHAWAEGDVPTPDGPISVSWKQTTDGLAMTVRHPESLKPFLNPYPECPVASCQFIPYSK